MTKIRNIEQIKAKTNIHLILEYLGIDTQGQKMICCPLHGEKTPSFSIYNEGKNWTCFGECNTGGDGIKLVQLYKGISYYEAVQEVGNLVGIQPEFSNISEAELAEMQSRSKIEKVLEKLNDYFRENLWATISTDSDKARDYLFSERLVDRELAHIYEIGYAPWDYTDILIEMVENGDITLEELIEFRLLGTKDIEIPTRTNVYCTFKNRITIPVIENGRIIGIIGRDIDKDAVSKYMKIGYTDYWDGIVWRDGEQLEGHLEGHVLHIIEGQFDALTVKQCGIDNIWSVNGVHSLTPRVVEKIKKMSPDKIYIHLDWDSTGEKAETQWAEKLGHRGYIVPSINGLKDNNGKEIKDINRLFSFLYEQEKANGSDDETAFSNTIDMVLTNLQSRIEKAENLIDIEFSKWESIEDEILKAEGLERLIEVVYKQYSGNPEMLSLFYEKQLKPLKIGKGNFDKYIKKFEKEVNLVPYKHGQGLEIPEWEVIDGILYKCIPFMEGGEYDYRRVEVTRTVPEISKILVNVNTNLSEIEITYKDKRGKFRREVLTDISTRKGILDSLRGKDFDASEKNIVDVMDYLNYIDVELGEEAEIENITERFGWHNDYRTFVLGNEILGESVVTFRGAGLGEEQKSEAYTIKGDLNGWKDIIQLISGRKWMMMELYTSFLPPLLPILEQNNFVLSNYGETSSGKTLTNRVAGSVWGNTNKNSNIENSIYDGNHMTLDKLEKSIALHTHIPIFINDIHNMRKNVASKMLYFIESGKGGGRGGIGGGSQLSRDLRTILYTTSESPLLNDGASENKGELARGFEFHGSPLEEKNIKLVLEIENIVENNYGHAGRLFIQNLLDRNGNFKGIVSKYKEIKSSLIDEKQSNILNRLIPNLAGVILAGILANEILDLGLTEDKITQDVISCIEIVKDEIDDAPYHITALETVADFLITYKNMFYYQGYADSSSDIEQDKATREVYGNKKYGVWRDDEGYIGMVKTELENFLRQEGVDPNRCYRGWKEDGYIDTDKKGYTKQVYDPQLKSNVRMLKFNLNMLVDYIGETKKPEYPVPRNLRVVTPMDIEEAMGIVNSLQ